MRETFKIFQVDAVEAKKIIASENEPHHHDFEELIIGTGGQLEHFIDFKSTVLDAPFVSFVNRGKVHRVKPVMNDGKCQMWAIRFKSEFIPETTFQLYSLYHDHASIELQTGTCFDRLDTLCRMMDDEMQQPAPDYAIIRQLLEANFRRNVGVAYYAEKLFMSARNLNNICHQILQQSVSEIIETRKLIEAKNLLSTTDKTISEIGFELGYNEKAYFTNVFKKKAGQTPTAFRSEMKKLVS